MMTAAEILEIVKANDYWTSDGDYECFGLRADRAGITVGTVLPNSHQWWQDYREDDWGELPDPSDYNSNPDHPYNEELGCWDDGELDGVCTVGITGTTESAIAQALELIKSYTWDHQTVYLVAGNNAQTGNDIGETIISDGTVIAIVG